MKFSSGNLLKSVEQNKLSYKSIEVTQLHEGLHTFVISVCV